MGRQLEQSFQEAILANEDSKKIVSLLVKAANERKLISKLLSLNSKQFRLKM